MRISNIVDDLRTAVSKADSAFERAVVNPFFNEDENDFERQNAEWWIETTFLKLVAATEALGLVQLRDMVVANLTSARSDNEGLTKSEMGPDEPYSTWLSKVRQFIAAIETLGGGHHTYSVTKDVTEILRATQYSLVDPKLFGSPPKNEDDVHRRIEGVLRCVFPDLRHKPSLSKPIKNFQPDTGLPGVRTLIEYKYLSKAGDAAIIADQILADTRGYDNSPEWDTFVYVIYETNRFRPEVEWNQLLESCGASANTTAIVISGEPAPEDQSPLARSRSSPAT